MKIRENQNFKFRVWKKLGKKMGEKHNHISKFIDFVIY